MSVPLSPREREIARLSAQGRTAREIGRALGIRDTTVNAHKRAIHLKMGVYNRVELAAVLLRDGIMTQEEFVAIAPAPAVPPVPAPVAPCDPATEVVLPERLCTGHRHIITGKTADPMVAQRPHHRTAR